MKVLKFARYAIIYNYFEKKLFRLIATAQFKTEYKMQYVNFLESTIFPEI